MCKSHELRAPYEGRCEHDTSGPLDWLFEVIVKVSDFVCDGFTLIPEEDCVVLFWIKIRL